MVRSERPDDGPIIASLVARAYADVPYSDHREALMIERLRENDTYLPELSLLAELDDVPIGHILLTRAAISDDVSTTETLALAPLSVIPDYQKRGVGKQLVRTAHEKAIALGFRSIVLVGSPDYYLQFGYHRLSDYPITLPFQAPDVNCMILPLVSGALDGVAGQVRYAPGWLDH